MPPFQRPDINNRDKFIKCLIDLVRDKYLLEEAFSQNIDKSPKVKESINKYYKELLALEFKKSILAADNKLNAPEMWKARNDKLAELKDLYIAKIDTSEILKIMPKNELNEKVPAMKFVVREQYKW